MAKLKTTVTEVDVFEFIGNLESQQKRNDSLRLVEVMQKVTGFEPKMWGPTIIGFGNYHYKYASGHEGDMPLVGFSPRKAAISLYIYSEIAAHDGFLENLGKFTMGKSCIYAKKLADINEEALVSLMNQTINYLKNKYE